MNGCLLFLLAVSFCKQKILIQSLNSISSAKTKCKDTLITTLVQPAVLAAFDEYINQHTQEYFPSIEGKIAHRKALENIFFKCAKIIKEVFTLTYNQDKKLSFSHLYACKNALDRFLYIFLNNHTENVFVFELHEKIQTKHGLFRRTSLIFYEFFFGIDAKQQFSELFCRVFVREIYDTWSKKNQVSFIEFYDRVILRFVFDVAFPTPEQLIDLVTDFEDQYDHIIIHFDTFLNFECLVKHCQKRSENRKPTKTLDYEAISIDNYVQINKFLTQQDYYGGWCEIILKKFPAYDQINIIITKASCEFEDHVLNKAAGLKYKKMKESAFKSHNLIEFIQDAHKNLSKAFMWNFKSHHMINIHHENSKETNDASFPFRLEQVVKQECLFSLKNHDSAHLSCISKHFRLLKSVLTIQFKDGNTKLDDQLSSRDIGCIQDEFNLSKIGLDSDKSMKHEFSDFEIYQHDKSRITQPRRLDAILLRNSEKNTPNKTSAYEENSTIGSCVRESSKFSQNDNQFKNNELDDRSEADPYVKENLKHSDVKNYSASKSIQEDVLNENASKCLNSIFLSTKINKEGLTITHCGSKKILEINLLIHYPATTRRVFETAKKAKKSSRIIFERCVDKKPQSIGEISDKDNFKITDTVEEKLQRAILLLNRYEIDLLLQNIDDLIFQITSETEETPFDPNIDEDLIGLYEICLNFATLNEASLAFCKEMMHDRKNYHILYNEDHDMEIVCPGCDECELKSGSKQNAKKDESQKNEKFISSSKQDEYQNRPKTAKNSNSDEQLVKGGGLITDKPENTRQGTKYDACVNENIQTETRSEIESDLGALLQQETQIVFQRDAPWYKRFVFRLFTKNDVVDVEKIKEKVHEWLQIIFKKPQKGSANTKLFLELKGGLMDCFKVLKSAVNIIETFESKTTDIKYYNALNSPEDFLMWRQVAHQYNFVQYDFQTDSITSENIRGNVYASILTFFEEIFTHKIEIPVDIFKKLSMPIARRSYIYHLKMHEKTISYDDCTQFCDICCEISKRLSICERLSSRSLKTIVAIKLLFLQDLDFSDCLKDVFGMFDLQKTSDHFKDGCLKTIKDAHDFCRSSNTCLYTHLDGNTETECSNCEKEDFPTKKVGEESFSKTVNTSILENNSVNECSQTAEKENNNDSKFDSFHEDVSNSQTSSSDHKYPTQESYKGVSKQDGAHQQNKDSHTVCKKTSEEECDFEIPKFQECSSLSSSDSEFNNSENPTLICARDDNERIERLNELDERLQTLIDRISDEKGGCFNHTEPVNNGFGVVKLRLNAFSHSKKINENLKQIADVASYSNTEVSESVESTKNIDKDSNDMRNSKSTGIMPLEKQKMLKCSQNPSFLQKHQMKQKKHRKNERINYKKQGILQSSSHKACKIFEVVSLKENADSKMINYTDKIYKKSMKNDSHKRNGQIDLVTLLEEVSVDSHVKPKKREIPSDSLMKSDHNQLEEIDRINKTTSNSIRDEIDDQSMVSMQESSKKYAENSGRHLQNESKIHINSNNIFETHIIIDPLYPSSEKSLIKGKTEGMLNCQVVDLKEKNDFDIFASIKKQGNNKKYEKTVALDSEWRFRKCDKDAVEVHFAHNTEQKIIKERNKVQNFVSGMQKNPFLCENLSDKMFRRQKQQSKIVLERKSTKKHDKTKIIEQVVFSTEEKYNSVIKFENNDFSLQNDASPLESSPREKSLDYYPSKNIHKNVKNVVEIPINEEKTQMMHPFLPLKAENKLTYADVAKKNRTHGTNGPKKHLQSPGNNFSPQIKDCTTDSQQIDMTKEDCKDQETLVLKFDKTFDRSVMDIEAEESLLQQNYRDRKCFFDSKKELHIEKNISDLCNQNTSVSQEINRNEFESDGSETLHTKNTLVNVSIKSSLSDKTRIFTSNFDAKSSIYTAVQSQTPKNACCFQKEDSNPFYAEKKEFSDGRYTNKLKENAETLKDSGKKILANFSSLNQPESKKTDFCTNIKNRYQRHEHKESKTEINTVKELKETYEANEASENQAYMEFQIGDFSDLAEAARYCDDDNVRKSKGTHEGAEISRKLYEFTINSEQQNESANSKIEDGMLTSPAESESIVLSSLSKSEIVGNEQNIPKLCKRCEKIVNLLDCDKISDLKQSSITYVDTQAPSERPDIFSQYEFASQTEHINPEMQDAEPLIDLRTNITEPNHLDRMNHLNQSLKDQNQFATPPDLLGQEKNQQQSIETENMDLKNSDLIYPKNLALHEKDAIKSQSYEEVCNFTVPENNYVVSNIAVQNMWKSNNIVDTPDLQCEYPNIIFQPCQIPNSAENTSNFDHSYPPYYPLSAHDSVTYFPQHYTQYQSYNSTFSSFSQAPQFFLVSVQPISAIYPIISSSSGAQHTVVAEDPPASALPLQNENQNA